MDNTPTRSCCWHWRDHQATQGTARFSPRLRTACNTETWEFFSVNVSSHWFSCCVEVHVVWQLKFLLLQEQSITSWFFMKRSWILNVLPAFVSLCLPLPAAENHFSQTRDTHETEPSHFGCLALLSQKLMLWSWRQSTRPAIPSAPEQSLVFQLHSLALFLCRHHTWNTTSILFLETASWDTWDSTFGTFSPTPCLHKHF